MNTQSHISPGGHSTRNVSGATQKEKGIQESLSLQQVQVAQIPPAALETILSLLAGQGLNTMKCTSILEQLLHYARTWQQGLLERDDVAVIAIPNLLSIHRRDHWTCCCYQTAHTFLRMLCALQILRKCKDANGGTEYHLSLAPDFVFQVTDEVLAEMRQLCDPARTKNKRVREKAKDVLRRLLLLASRQERVQQGRDEKEKEGTPAARIAHALEHIHHLLCSVGSLNMDVSQSLMVDIGSVLVELFRGDKESRVVVDSFCPMPARVERKRSQMKDSAQQCRGARRSAIKQTPGKAGSDVDSVSSSAQNLQANERLFAPASASEEDSEEISAGTQNLQSETKLSSTSAPIDNDKNNINITSLSGNSSSGDISQNNGFIDIDKNRPGKKQPVLPGCYQLDARSARSLAAFVEHNRGDNFPAFIALSKVCSPLAIRAAIVNMLAHRYFPDLDGRFDGEVDGEITGKWGRPKRPGAWVTDLAKAYQQMGIPAVMHLLLSHCHTDDQDWSYRRIEQEFIGLEQQQTPEQFWSDLQEQLCEQRAVSQLHAAGDQEDVFSFPQEGSAREDEGMPVEAARELAKQINRDGAPYGISARAWPAQEGRWEVEMRILLDQDPSVKPGNEHMFTQMLRSEQDWLEYFASMKELDQQLAQGS